MRILLDIDGVVCDFTGPLVAKANRILATDFNPESVDRWDYASALGLSVREDARLYQAINEHGWTLGLPMYAGTIEAIAELRTIGSVVAVTAPMRGKTWGHERARWLVELLGFKHEDIVITSAKHLVRGDVLIDDRLSNVLDWEDEHQDNHLKGILWRSPSNRHDMHHTECSTWDEVFAELRSR